MTDIYTPEKRSWVMSRIQSSNTKPEKAVRSLLHNLGYRYRLHKKDLPGKPDITLPKYKTVIFVHGCFWHRHEGCKYANAPKSRKEFWQKKFKANIERDKRNQKELITLEWKVIVLWECEIERIEKIKDRLLNELQEIK